MAASDPQAEGQFNPAALEAAVVGGLREKGWTVIEPSTAAGIAYVGVSKELLVQLAERESEPIVLLGVAPDERGGYELIVRRPTRPELQAAVMERFKTAAARVR